MVIQCPCISPKSGTLITISNFLRESSTLPWLGQHQCQLGYLRGAHSLQNPTNHAGLTSLGTSHCLVDSLMHIKGGKAA